ncbi:MAG: segregation/condensation protein A [Nitrospirota bacterium]
MPEVLEKTHIEQKEHQNQTDFPAGEIDRGIISPTTPSGVYFRLSAFEGPLDLLLHFIRNQKIDIYDIPIVQITQQYMEYIKIMEELDLEIAGDFLVMAATLIHIKSRVLLPPDEEEMEESVEDPRAELVQRLLEYQSYQDSSTHLRKREDIWKNVFQRPATDMDSLEFEEEPMLIDANVFDLISAFRKLLEKVPEQAIEITRETLTVSGRINFIVEKLENEDGMRFEDLFEEGFTKVTLIVTFLALLELVRLGLSKIYQEKAFEQIWIMNPQHEPSSSSAEVAEEIQA